MHGDEAVHGDEAGRRDAADRAALLEDAVADLGVAHGLQARLSDRTILITSEVRGSPHLAVLQALGLAARAAPVGAAAHGPTGVAAGVWLAPDLYLVRWTGANRWVAGYRFSRSGRPDDYVREATGIPSQLARGDWHGEVPDEVAESFLDVGILLDEPPFPVPQPPPTPPPAATPARPARSTRSARSGPSEGTATGTTSATGSARAARTKPARPARPAKKAAAPTLRSCPSCHLQKHVSQFEPGSDLCADCR